MEVSSFFAEGHYNTNSALSVLYLRACSCGIPGGWDIGLVFVCLCLR